MTFSDCVIYCSQNRELVENFDRLRGTNLSQVGRRAPIDRMVDEATGRDDDSMGKFCAFVWEFVWTRLPPEAFEQ